MTTFSYTSGDPANLVGGATANMSDISGPFADLVAFLNGNIDATNIAAGGVDVAELASTLAVVLGVTQSGAVRRGKSIIATEQTTTATTYAVGNLATPDRVQNIVLPTDGLICVHYQAQWKNSVGAATGSAGIFLGANQLKAPDPSQAAPQVLDEFCSGNANTYTVLSTIPTGLYDGTRTSTAYTGNVTTGQVVATQASGQIGGPCYIFAAAGTYDVSVQFKTSSGTQSVKERNLWVWTMGF